jgi:hypothetical protein
MAGRIITYPDQLATINSVMIINALEHDIETLVYWLTTTAIAPDIHLYNSNMPYPEWAAAAICNVKTILVSQDCKHLMNPVVSQALARTSSNVIYYGAACDCPSIMKYFVNLV